MEAPGTTKVATYLFLFSISIFLAHNGSAIKMILQEDEEQTEHDHERGGLVMEPEERVVYGELVPLEPLQQVADDRQSVGDCRRRHFVVLLV